MSAVIIPFAPRAAFLRQRRVRDARSGCRAPSEATPLRLAAAPTPVMAVAPGAASEEKERVRRQVRTAFVEAERCARTRGEASLLQQVRAARAITLAASAVETYAIVAAGQSERLSAGDQLFVSTMRRVIAAARDRQLVQSA